jgi:hypothetical protein
VITKTSDLLTSLRKRSDWSSTVLKLCGPAEERRDTVDEHVDGYVGRYQGHRAAMVVDVVLPQRRRYKNLVLPSVEKWRDDHREMTLEDLALEGAEDLRRDLQYDSASTSVPMTRRRSEMSLRASLHVVPRLVSIRTLDARNGRKRLSP